MKKLLLILLFLCILPVYLQAQECFMILVGKNATKDGSVLIAHNNDLTGIETSFVEKIPRRKYSQNDVVSFPSGLTIPQVKETYEWMVLRIEAGYAEGDAIAINEFQVSIGGGVALGADRNEKAKESDPLIKNGLTGGVRFIALERSKTARECVELIGSLYTKYGVTYPSGAAIADPNEIWYIEAGGGHTWAAVRIPDNKFMAVANGYRIGEINPDDTANVLTSPGLIKFAEENQLWNSSEGKFNFAKTFGGGRDNRFYDTRRVWRGISLLSEYKAEPDETDFPMFVKPEDKLDIKTMFDLLRDKYEKTPFELINGERTICINRTVHSSIVQLRDWLPNVIGAVLWTGLSVPVTSVYIPFYYGIGEINPNYNSYAKETSAFWKFRELYKLTEMNPDFVMRIRDEFNNIERKIVSKQTEMEETAMEFSNSDPKETVGFLTYYVNGLCEIVLKEAGELLNK